MAELVEIPWQAGLFLEEGTLARFDRASDILGARILLNPSTNNPSGRALSAWRSYSQQNYLYQGYIHGLPGFNVASSPDSGPRMHMRGGAGDTLYTNKATRQACLDAGLVPDPEENWHWNDPRLVSMPIIKTNVQEEEEAMYRLILTKKGATADANLYDQFTGLSILHNVPRGEAIGYNEITGADQSLDGTTTAGKAVAKNVRANWQRQIDANLAAIKTSISIDPGSIVIDYAKVGAAAAASVVSSLPWVINKP